METQWVFECPECKKWLSLPTYVAAGDRKIRCPYCREAFDVPTDVKQCALIELSNGETARRRKVEKREEKKYRKLLHEVRALEGACRTRELSKLKLEDLRGVREKLEARRYCEALEDIEVGSQLVARDDDEKEFNASMRRRGAVEYLQFMERLERIEEGLNLLTYKTGSLGPITHIERLANRISTLERRMRGLK